MRIDPTLYQGRPADQREAREERCYELLDSLGIEYFRVDHEPAEDIKACELVEGLLGCGICKNLFLTNRQQTRFYLLVMPGEKPFKTKLLSAQIQSARLSFGSADDMLRLLDLYPGSVSVLGLMNDKEGKVQLLIDRELLAAEYYGCHPCRNSTSLRFRTAELLERILPAMHHEPQFVDLPWNVEE